jgi:hypothetical protein
MLTVAIPKRSASPEEDFEPRILRCITCAHVLRRRRPSDDAGLMIRCRRCRTLQHHRLGHSP